MYTTMNNSSVSADKLSNICFISSFNFTLDGIRIPILIACSGYKNNNSKYKIKVNTIYIWS